MELKFLADNENAIPIIASWYFNEWGQMEEGNTFEKTQERLHSYLNRDKIPLVVLAEHNDEILGVAQLKYREMDIYPEKEHWLGGVYVSEKHRGKKIAGKLIEKVVSLAISLDVQVIYLQTENLSGGLYRRLGWHPLEQVNYRDNDVLVMERRIG